MPGFFISVSCHRLQRLQREVNAGAPLCIRLGAVGTDQLFAREEAIGLRQVRLLELPPAAGGDHLGGRRALHEMQATMAIAVRPLQ